MPTGKLSNQNYVEGDSLSPRELCVRFDIPREEIASFQHCIRVYSKGEVIINEGDVDHSLFLIRHGQVDVFKKSDENKRELLGTISAVNFVGEMALINDEPRNATVIATKGEVLAYAITRPNLGLILTNSKWAEMLIARLSKNLAQSNVEKVQSIRVIDDLQRKVESLQSQLDVHLKRQEIFDRNIVKTLATLFFFEQAIQDRAVYGSRSWGYLKIFQDVTLNLFDRWVPGLKITPEDANFQGLLSALRIVGRQTPGGISSELIEWMEKYIADQ